MYNKNHSKNAVRECSLDDMDSDDGTGLFQLFSSTNFFLFFVEYNEMK